jgi:hypothetical protein
MDMKDLENRVLSLKEKARVATEASIRAEEQQRVALLKEAEALAALSAEYGVGSLDEAKALLASKLSLLEETLKALEEGLADA